MVTRTKDFLGYGIARKLGESPTKWDGSHPTKEPLIFLLLMPTNGDQMRRVETAPLLKQQLSNGSLNQNHLEGSLERVSGPTARVSGD